LSQQFRRAMQAAGINPPGEIIADGRLHRFSTNGERGDDAGWYVLHADGIPAGAFGDWRSGISETWRADLGRRLTREEEAEARRRIEEARAEAEAERQRRAKRAAELAAAIWKAASPASPDHPYLKRKGVAPTVTLRALHATEFARRAGYAPQARGEPLEGMLLIAPVKGREHNPATLELIDEQGRKSALAGGVKAGGYWATGPLPSSGRVVIAEGIATALSIAQALGEPVAAALSVGNLRAAAETILAERPGVQIVIAADLGDEGRPHPEAVKAAQALRCPLAAPPADLGKGGDFNDLHARDGLEAVRACIEAAAPPVGPAVSEAMPRDEALRLAREALMPEQDPGMPYPVHALRAAGWRGGAHRAGRSMRPGAGRSIRAGRRCAARARHRQCAHAGRRYQAAIPVCDDDRIERRWQG
jgi:putative DNA primase/helicase